MLQQSAQVGAQCLRGCVFGKYSRKFTHNVLITTEIEV